MLRIKNELKNSGYFWLPSKPERKIPGVLTIVDGGNIELQALGLFNESIEGPRNTGPGTDSIKRIVGDIDKHGYITLDDCFYTSKNIAFNGISKSSICANKAYIGIAYDEDDVITFNEFRFSIEGIDEWVGISGIEVESDYEKKISLIKYTPPESISLPLNNGMTLLITYSWTLPGFPIQKEAKITQKTFFQLISKKALPLEDFISTSHKITTLLDFAIDQTACIDSVSASNYANFREISNHSTSITQIMLFYSSLPYTKNVPQISEHKMLFKYRQIEENAAQIINNWLEAYDEIQPSLNLYFSAKMGSHKYLDGKFLALAQGLETYHRRTSDEKNMADIAFNSLFEKLIRQCPAEHQEWLSARLRYGNEISLRQRIKNILIPFKAYFGSNAEQSTLIQSIVDTRNYLTHYDPTLEERSLSGRQLLMLCNKLEAIFQLHLLRVLSFTETEIQSIFKKSYALQQKLR